jgi:hypothetical protein
MGDAFKPRDRGGVDGDLDAAGVWFTLMLPGAQLLESPLRSQLVKNRASLERSETMPKRVLQFVDPKMIGTPAISIIQERATVLIGHFAPFASGRIAADNNIGK